MLNVLMVVWGEMDCPDPRKGYLCVRTCHFYFFIFLRVCTLNALAITMWFCIFVNARDCNVKLVCIRNFDALNPLTDLTLGSRYLPSFRVSIHSHLH